MRYKEIIDRMNEILPFANTKQGQFQDYSLINEELKEEYSALQRALITEMNEMTLDLRQQVAYYEKKKYYANRKAGKALNVVGVSLGKL